MALAFSLEPVASLPKVPASDVKKFGCRGIMTSRDAGHGVVITNHDKPEAVLLPATEYERIVRFMNEFQTRDEATLDALRARFDARLAVLGAPQAGDALRAAARAPVKLRGRLKAGASY